MIKQDRFRISVTITDKLNKKLVQWAARMGVTKGQLANICILSGIDTIIRAVSPLDSMTPDQLNKLLMAFERKDKSEEFQAFIN